MDDVVLYHYPLSYGSQIVRLALAEKRVSWKGRVVDISLPHENFRPWFVRLNPRAAVPALVHDGHVFTDVVDICRYVDERFAGPALVPPNGAARAEMEEWIALHQEFPERELSCALATGPTGWLARWELQRQRRILRRYRVRYPELEAAYDNKLAVVSHREAVVRDPQQVEALRTRINGMVERLETHLRHQPWLAGDAYSLADTVWTVLLARLLHLGQVQLLEGTRFPCALAYYLRMKSRPSFAAAAVTEGREPRWLLRGAARAYGLRAVAAAGLAALAVVALCHCAG